MKRIDLTGKKFGKLTVDKMLYQYNGTKETKCLCHCDCGKKNIIRGAYRLKHAAYSSCGCGKKEYIIKTHGRDINNQRFGRLIVIETIWGNNPPLVKCKCDCGQIVTLKKHDVQSGHTKSCGCITLDRLNDINNVNHANKISDYGIIILSKAERNNKNQWLWNCKCGYCGNIFKELPARVLGNHVRSCGCLKVSSTEKFIESYLTELNVEYKTEFTFTDCISDKKYLLRFDFAIFKNGKVFYLIEYDGQQHFHPVEIFGGKKAYQEQLIRDNLKNEYCKKNNINLLRLNYMQTENEIKENITNIIYP